MTNEKLNEILSISAKEHEVITYSEPDYAYIHRELSKKGVTFTLLWSEYCERCYANGEMPYMSTQFGDKYRNWARITKATMRIDHKPGETMQVDWASGTIPYLNCSQKRTSTAAIYAGEYRGCLTAESLCVIRPIKLTAFWRRLFVRRSGNTRRITPTSRKMILYLHLTMDDNLSLSEEIKQR